MITEIKLIIHCNSTEMYSVLTIH